LTDPDPTPEPLQRAAQHLRQGEFDLASTLLAAFLQENPHSADAWVLFSFALEDPVRKLECAERALQLEPEHAQAAQRLRELRERFPDVQTTWARPKREPSQEPAAGEQAGPVPGSQGMAPAAPEPAEPIAVPAAAGTLAEPAAGPGTAYEQTPAESAAGPADTEAPAEPSAVTGPLAPQLAAQPEPTSGPFAPEGPAEPEPAQAPPVPPFSVPVAEAEQAVEAPPAFMAELESGAPQPAEAAEPAAPTEAPASQPKRRSGAVVALGVLFGCAAVAGAAALLYSLAGGQLTGPGPSPTAPAATLELPAATPVVLPPSWTPSFTPTITPTRTPRPTSTPTPTPTFIPPNPTQLAYMDIIQQQVQDLRGLAYQGPVSAYLITRLKARAVLEDMYRSAGGSEAQLEDQKRELVALGLVKPTYNLIDTVLNGLADAVGGFFDPMTKRMFVIGGSLGAVERFVYSHEFAHALVDQHYPFDRTGAYPSCQLDQDRCRAIRGLVEGDATLIMNQWLPYASPQDYLELLTYVPPAQALPEQFPPPFAIKDSEFPYLHGRAFVQTLHNRGNWAEVNRAYANLPLSSEQILHPEKYLAGERPQQVHPPALEGSLGEGWRRLASDVLGEWGTYLLLGYSADLEAQIGDSVALNAARGWSGDRYQVYYQDASARTVLAALWRWDTTAEATEFFAALHQHLNSRFRGLVLIRGAGACWEAPDQVSCIYQRGTGVLWILAPDQPTLDLVLESYPGFP
jgi:hypothetical protein